MLGGRGPLKRGRAIRALAGQVHIARVASGLVLIAHMRVEAFGTARVIGAAVADHSVGTENKAPATADANQIEINRENWRHRHAQISASSSASRARAVDVDRPLERCAGVDHEHVVQNARNSPRPLPVTRAVRWPQPQVGWLFRCTSARAARSQSLFPFAYSTNHPAKIDKSPVFDAPPWATTTLMRSPASAIWSCTAVPPDA